MGCDYCIATNLVVVFKINEETYKKTIYGKAQGRYFANNPEDDEEVMNSERRPLECIYDTAGLYDKMINTYIDEDNDCIKRYEEYHNKIKDGENQCEWEEIDVYYTTEISLSNIVSINRKTIVWKRF